jgi:5'-3' exoribonuclease 1
MGVPYYFYVITQQHPGILRNHPPSNIQRFYLDYNGGVHPVCHRLFAQMRADGAPSSSPSASPPSPPPSPSAAAFEARLCEESWVYMLSLVREIRPAEVHIALDGVAPIAKIQQQRKRRYLSILRQKLTGDFSPWDTNAISPGTRFMTQLNEYFRHKIQQTFSPIPFHFYGSDEPGEGEHKIFQHLAALPTPTQPQVVYGLDADLIMLSLLSHRPQLFLMRERQKEEGFVYLDIDALRVGILKTLAKDYQWTIPAEAIQDPFHPWACEILENYVMACFILGNDFIPNITCLHLKKNGISTVLNTFKETWNQLGHPLITISQPPVAAAPSLEFLARWFGILAEKEFSLLSQMNEDYYKKRCFIHNEEDKVEFYPIQPENKSRLSHALMNQTATGPWRSLYYKHLLDCERQDRGVVVQACREYIHGMLWTYQYYKQRPKPADWYYPFAYAPTLLDLGNQLAGEMEDHLNTQRKWSQLPPPAPADFLPPTLQLLAILPPESHPMLPCPAPTAPGSGVRHLFPTSYPIYTYLKTHLWECSPKLPILDLPALRDFLRRLGRI